MPYHEYGDAFNFRPLYEAADRCERLYRRLTKKSVMWKEKYGTIRYECTFLWLTEPGEVELFSKILKHIIKYYPSLAGELVENWIVAIEHPYWTPYFEGVLWVSNQEEWVSYGKNE